MHFNVYKKQFYSRELTIMTFFFLLAYGYILFFTAGVPLFWDDHQFNTYFANTRYAESIKQLITPTTHRIDEAPRATYGIIIRTLTFLFGYHFFFYRAVKALFFAGTIAAFYFLLKKLDFSQTTACAASFILLTNYPFYLHTLVFDEPFIIAEFFKIVALYLLLSDVQKEQTSYLRQISIAVFGVLTLRSYPPGYALAGIIATFLLLTRLRYFRRYFFLMIFIILFNFPLSLFEKTPLLPNQVNFENFRHVFLPELTTTFFAIPPDLNDLYHVPIYHLLGFFGIITTLISLAILIIKREKKHSKTLHHALCTPFALSWLASELPILLVIMETATRYLSALMPPMILLLTTFASTAYSRLNNKTKSPYSFLLTITLLGMLFTNITYVYAFRASWGSAFIGEELAAQWIENKAHKNTGVLYHATSVANAYTAVNRKNNNYCLAKNPTYQRALDIDDYTPKKLEIHAQTYDQFYAVQRISGRGKNKYPPLNLSNRPDLELVKTIYGTTNTPFDLINSFIIDIFSIPYNPNTVSIYHYQHRQ